MPILLFSRYQTTNAVHAVCFAKFMQCREFGLGCTLSEIVRLRERMSFKIRNSGQNIQVDGRKIVCLEGSEAFFKIK